MSMSEQGNIYEEFDKEAFKKHVERCMSECYLYASRNGFYYELRSIYTSLLIGSKTELDWFDSTCEQAAIARIHSELSEWLETVRKEPLKKDEHCPDFLSAEVEAADAVIRIFDLCHFKGYNLAKAIIAKMEYNTTRPYKHGKNS